MNNCDLQELKAIYAARALTDDIEFFGVQDYRFDKDGKKNYDFWFEIKGFRYRVTDSGALIMKGLNDTWYKFDLGSDARVYKRILALYEERERKEKEAEERYLCAELQRGLISPPHQSPAARVVEVPFPKKWWEFWK